MFYPGNRRYSLFNGREINTGHNSLHSEDDFHWLFFLVCFAVEHPIKSWGAGFVYHIILDLDSVDEWV